MQLQYRYVLYRLNADINKQPAQRGRWLVRLVRLGKRLHDAPLITRADREMPTKPVPNASSWSILEVQAQEQSAASLAQHGCHAPRVAETGPKQNLSTWMSVCQSAESETVISTRETQSGPRSQFHAERLTTHDPLERRHRRLRRYIPHPKFGACSVDERGIHRSEKTRA